MENELEIIAAASAGSAIGATHHPVQPGMPCANCGEVVEERYCTVCGQLASDFHRPVWNLIAAGLSDIFALDGRLWRTLPALLFRPGRVTRNYLDGQRARYVPPFRLFLLSSILFFLALFTLGEELGWYDSWNVDLRGVGNLNVTIDEDTEVGLVDQEALDELQAVLDDDASTEEQKAEAALKLENLGNAIVIDDLLNADGTFDRAAVKEAVESRIPEEFPEERLDQTMREIDRLATIYENQNDVIDGIKTWTPRVSFLFLPIFSALVALVYAWRRKFYFYDHLITGLHFQTFLYLMGTAFIVLGVLVPPLIGLLWTAALLLPIVYLYRMLRVTYSRGHIVSALRAFVLYQLSMMVLVMLVTAMVVFVALTIG